MMIRRREREVAESSCEIWQNIGKKISHSIDRSLIVTPSTMDALKEEREEEEEEETEEATAASEAAIDASEDPVVVAVASEAAPEQPSSSSSVRSPSLPLPPNETRRKMNFERKLSLDASAFRPTTSQQQQQEKKRHSDFIREVPSIRDFRVVS